MNTTSKLAALVLPVVLLALSSVTEAADTTATATTTASTTTDHSASRPQNGRFVVQGNLETNQHIYYTGDALDIRVKFARGADLLASGDVNASIVIFGQDGAVSSVPVPADIGTTDRKFFAIQTIDTKTLPAGQYQLALILTAPKGNPTIINDWYSGFRAMLDVESIYISDVAVAGDANKDGEWDDDVDGDGIAGNEADAANLHVKK